MLGSIVEQSRATTCAHGLNLTLKDYVNFHRSFEETSLLEVAKLVLLRVDSFNSSNIDKSSAKLLVALLDLFEKILSWEFKGGSFFETRT